MKTSESIDKIATALLAAQKAMSPVEKGGVNNYDKYAYAKLENYLSVATPALQENGISLVTSGVEIRPIEGGRTTSQGKSENGVFVVIELTALHESGQWISVQSYGEGQDRGDKSTYKALTGARKYGVAMLFSMVTSDDPESTGDKPAATGNATADMKLKSRNGSTNASPL